MGKIMEWATGLSSGVQMAILGAVAVVVIALGLSVWWNFHQAAEVGRLEQGLSLATDTANRNAKTVIDLTNSHKTDMANLAALYDKERARNKRLNALIDEVMHAPDSDNGPLAPVLSGLPLRLLGDEDGEGGRDGQGSSAVAPPNMR